MKKMWVILLAFVAMPAFAQFRVFSTKQLSVATDNCVRYPDGSVALCKSQAGGDAVFEDNIILEKGRLYGYNGMSVSGPNIYLGDMDKGGIYVGHIGLVVQGQVAMRTQDGLAYKFPLVTGNGLTFWESSQDATTSDKGSTIVQLEPKFLKIANVDPATRGGYTVLCFAKKDGETVTVAGSDIFPDHFVARSNSGRAVTFNYIILALSEGVTQVRSLQPQPQTESLEKEFPDRLPERRRQ